jgi:hypothetical protein
MRYGRWRIAGCGGRDTCGMVANAAGRYMLEDRSGKDSGAKLFLAAAR